MAISIELQRTWIDIRKCCDHLAKTPRAPVTGISSVPFVANLLFPVSSRDWFTVISCLIVCVTDICFIALYVVKREGYKNYRSTCCKGQALFGNKSTEMPVRLNAVRVLSLWERMLKSCCFLHTIFD